MNIPSCYPFAHPMAFFLFQIKSQSLYNAQVTPYQCFSNFHVCRVPLGGLGKVKILTLSDLMLLAEGHTFIARQHDFPHTRVLTLPCLVEPIL